jgi:hypothetical protein
MKDLSSIYFPGKEPQERISMLLRRHPVVITKKLILIFLIGIIPVIIGMLINRYTTWLDDGTGLWYAGLLLLASVVYLFWLLLLYETWVNYYLDVWIVTDERIIAMEQVSLFHRGVSELRLNTIQDVSSNVIGMLPSLFRFGDIQVQTAANEEKFHFSQVPKPEIVARTILELREHYAGDDRQTVVQPATDGKELPPHENNPV